LFTILALVAGEMLWGIPGMILAIPIMGVTKIVCDHIEPLKPFGELIGGKDKKESSLKKKGKWLLKKIKLLFKKQDA
jgi:predicted PurR-regulated permease PerM